MLLHIVSSAKRSFAGAIACNDISPNRGCAVPEIYSQKVYKPKKCNLVWKGAFMVQKLDTEVEENPYISKFLQFFEMECKKEIESLASNYPEKRSLNIDFKQLEKFDYKLADELLDSPEYLLRAVEEAIEKIDVPSLEIDKFSPHIRFFNLPDDRKPLLRDIGSTHLNKLISVEGVIKQITDVLPKIKLAAWKCRRCGNTYRIEQLSSQEIKQPSFCECRHRDFSLMEEESEFIDYQKITIQEPLEALRGNEQPTDLNIYLADDLVNKVCAGDKVMITGLLRLSPGKKTTAVFGRFLDAIHIEETSREFEEIEIFPEEEEEIKALSKDPKIFEKLVASVAPAIYGHEIVKEAIILQLFGGVKKILPGNQVIRGNVHVLLVGDPGCLIGDERIVLGNGAIVRLEKLGKEHLESINQQVLTGQGYKRDIATVFHSYASQPILEVVTESGKCIKGTYNHPLLTVKNQKRKWKRLDELEIGDRIATVPWIPCTITAPIKTGWKKISRRYGPRCKAKLPQHLTPELGGLLGYLTGDGYLREHQVVFLVNLEAEDLINPLCKIIETNFTIKPRHTIRKRKDYRKPINVIYVHNKNIASNLSFLKEKRVPELIMCSGNKVVSEYLAWLFEADGCVFCNGRGRSAIQLKSTRIELLRDVQMLLLRFRVHSRIVEQNLQIKRAVSIERFAESIGFRSNKKQTRLKKLVSYCKKLDRKRGKELSEKIASINFAGIANVFDVEVPDSNRFIANGIVSHNTAKSQTLIAASNIAPKSIYVAGKTTTGAGITVTAVKDEFGEGGWTLKAGALVLASGGIVMADELDKMDSEERSSLHESMESGKISVAKAGIVSQFKTDTSILAAANPKFARFDPFTSFMEQVDLPATLISRFDLFFMIKDVLDRTKDGEIASHILHTHQSGQKLSQHRIGTKKLEKSDIEQIEKIATPAINPELLRKYMSYARQNIFPALTKEAMELISEFYVGLRERGREEGFYSATHRQLEGLVRLSEASARVRLKNKIEKEDAERAIRLLRFSLEDVVKDPESGEIDIDLVTTGQPHSQTEGMRKILQIVKEKSAELDELPLEVVYEEAKAAGIEKEKAEEFIRKLEKKGEIYRPRHNLVKPTQFR